MPRNCETNSDLYFLQLFSVAGDAALIPGKAVFFQAPPGAAAGFVLIDVNHAVALIHFDRAAGNNVNNPPHRIAQKLDAVAASLIWAICSRR